jgi:hypothetical protein
MLSVDPGTGAWLLGADFARRSFGTGKGEAESARYVLCLVQASDQGDFLSTLCY